MAASRGDAVSVEELLNRGIDPNSVIMPFYFGPALFEGIKGGHRDVAKLLISRGANVSGM